MELKIEEAELKPKAAGRQSGKLNHFAAPPRARSKLSNCDKKKYVFRRERKSFLCPTATLPPTQALGYPGAFPGGACSALLVGPPPVLTPSQRGLGGSGRRALGSSVGAGLVKKNKQRSKWRRFLSTQAPPPAREMQTAGGGPSRPRPPRPNCGWEGRAAVTRAAAPAPRALPSACPFAPDPAGGEPGPHPPSRRPPPGQDPRRLSSAPELPSPRARLGPLSDPPPGEPTPPVPCPSGHMAPVSNARQ